MTQDDFVGGLVHALMVSYRETVKARGEGHADEWLILHDVILSLAFLAAGLEAGESDRALRDILDDFHGKAAAGMVQARVPPDVVAGYEQKRTARFREYNPLIRRAGGHFASDAEMELGRIIAHHVGQPQSPTRAYAEFQATLRATKESLDQIFSRHPGFSHRARRFYRRAIGRFRGRSG